MLERLSLFILCMLPIYGGLRWLCVKEIDRQIQLALDLAAADESVFDFHGQAMTAEDLALMLCFARAHSMRSIAYCFGGYGYRALLKEYLEYRLPLTLEQKARRVALEWNVIFSQMMLK